MYKNVIFDVDGTLIDGTEGVLSSVIYTINKFHLAKLPEKDLLSFIGPPVQDSFKRIYNVSDGVAQEYANCFRNRYKNEDVYKAKVYDGIYELLEFLKNNGYKLGVATYKREDYAISLLEYLKLSEYFDVMCGADNENKLTKKDIMKICADKLGGDIKDSIMIGDSSHDAQASLELGIDFIAVTYGFGFKSKKDTEIYKPVFAANSPHEITEFFAKQ